MSALSTTDCLYYFGRSDPKVELVVLFPHIILGILTLFVQLYQINELDEYVSFEYQFNFSNPVLHLCCFDSLLRRLPRAGISQYPWTTTCTISLSG